MAACPCDEALPSKPTPLNLFGPNSHHNYNNK